MGSPDDKGQDKGIVAPHEAGKVDVLTDVPAQYPDVPSIAVATKNAALLEGGKFPKTVVLDGIRSLLAGELADETDRPLLTEAIEYIENPTDNFEDIKVHTKNIVAIAAMTYMGENIPPAIEALQAYFYALQCVNQMNFVEGELAKGVTDSMEIEAAITQALADAEVFANGYAKETTLLEAATALHDRLPEEVRNSMADRKLANRTIRKAPFSKDPAEAN